METIRARTFLSHIWPHPLYEDETLELRAIRRADKTIKREFHSSIPDFLKATKTYGPGWDIYFGVSTRYLYGGKKEDCYRVSCVWVDFDKVEKLPDLRKHPPTVVVNSGGGFHCYWALEAPVFLRSGDWKEIEAINRALSKKYKGDGDCVDITRILRVPDSLNYKYDPPRKVVASAYVHH